MAKFKADITFHGTKENKKFEKDEEFEMTVKRAEEIQTNIKKDYDIDQVMTRIDKDELKDEEKPEDEK